MSILAGLSLVLFANAALAQDFKIFNLKSNKKQLQIGEEWSRTTYDGKLTSTEALNSAIKATARVDLKNEQGSAFYLGKFNGVHLMLTNYHVLSEQEVCRTGKVYFAYLQKSFRCGLIIDKFRDLEATFFTIRVDKKDEYRFENIALKFDFVNEYKPGHRLVTAGYGIERNNNGKLTYENSQTCVVATTTYKTVLLTVQSEEKSYKARSFVHACEISSGDSGSAVISESTGKVVGLNWATSTSKPIALLNSLNVYEWIEKQSNLLWSYMSYAVPGGEIMNAIKASKNVTLNEFVNSHFNTP